jgi:hypothetical protein
MLCPVDMAARIGGVLEAGVWDERGQEMTSHLTLYMLESGRQVDRLRPSVRSTLHLMFSRRGREYWRSLPQFMRSMLVE